MSAIIKVENLSKIYRLGEIGTGTISRDIERWFRTTVLKQEDPFLQIGETNDRSAKGKSDVVYSLRDINFEIQPGDTVGIIGRNGAGKSTLLKILSRITSPTKGRITINGRVVSLLEVGTGFHPDLTGRENIYLNGSILGMRRREIDQRLDEIIDFSGVERYIDTPVKRYSSGMYVRLAFAVAANLKADVLVVDEVLAVGDSDFQKKCLGKMDDISSSEGRTVFFVSHDLAAIKRLCGTSIVLDRGRIVFFGEVQDGIQNFISSTPEKLNLRYERSFRKETKLFVQSAQLLSSAEENFYLKVKFSIKSKLELRVSINFILKDRNGSPIAYGCSHYFNKMFKIQTGENEIEIQTDPLKLAQGRYFLGFEIVDPGSEFFDVVESAFQFDVSVEEIANRSYGIAQSWGKGSFEISFK